MRKPLLHLLTGLLLACFILPAAKAQQQNLPFWNEIQQFKQQDSLQMPPKNAILFVGSSSIRMWDNLQQAFPKYTVINRGFGGSTLLDLKRYLNDIVFPYQPKQIVIYSGENDIATDTVQAPEVLERFKDVYQSIRKELPRVPLVFISIKPSPSRKQYNAIVQEANNLIRAYIRQQPNIKFADVYPRMLGSNNKPKPEIFLQDSLHMNNNGYRIWTKVITPYLIK
ncbi:G-D-S-L family lipolytic protein [Pontibacter sp. 172403-2]|uniref:GDSL-type esterase/lipase family protein n=1 Tax=Pontibacter rufus TaxID=2791028 RepID=UPI0018AF6B2B|nr:GDSL-type esterase/lipase family protein [Pontibacter sp. 172403-2]MBF9253701.1 G-D-S-L family lipolytic protein [Pontibacter sp. 172403-2]